MRMKPGTLSSEIRKAPAGLAEKVGLDLLVVPTGESVQVTITEESQMGDTEC